MAVTEAARHDLYAWCQQTMGAERAATLMAMISPTGWADVATKQDLALLHTEMAALRTELKGDMAGLRAELKGEMKQFVTKDYLEKALRTQLMATFGFYGIFMSLAVTLVR